MNGIHEQSIERKLSMIVLISGSLALFLAGLFLVVLEFNELRINVQDEMRLIARLVGDRSTAALILEDRGLATENIETLVFNPLIVATCIFDRKGRVFAKKVHYPTGESDCATTGLDSDSRFEGTGLLLSQDISLDGETIGSIYIRADLSELYLRKIKFFGLVGLVSIAALVIAFVVSLPLSKMISGRVRRLVDKVRVVAKCQDYSLRVGKEEDDELDQLVDEFNRMLGILEKQNQALVRANDRYLALYDDNPTMIVNVDIQGRIVSMNQFSADLLGFPLDKLTGRSIFDYTHSDDARSLLELLGSCVDQPDSIHKLDIRNVLSDGEMIWVRQSARLVMNDKQEPNVLIVSEDITETRQLTDKIAYQASHDSLTDLVNRAEFEEHIKTAVAYARTHNVEHVLCYLDLDQFKVVNDTCGHIAGDELLRQLGHTLKRSIRQRDVLARLGGDEFGILMQNCTLDNAIKAVEKIRKNVRDFYFAWEESSFTVGVSIGVTSINSASGNQVELLKEADAACYAAKENGRDRVHIFHPDDEELAKRHGEMQWVGKIRTALDEDRFCLFGQQIIAVAGGPEADPGYHFETLIRLRDKAGRMVPPGAFLPAAERYNLSPTIDRWVFTTILEWLSSYPEFLDRLAVCSINLSGLSLSEEKFLDFIINEFTRWSVPAHKICFEITETAAISNLTNATNFIRLLKQENCLFSLDDFGSGLSSFGYLKNLPVDFLKIDGLFVKDIVTDPVDLAMVRSINEVGHVMGKKTIAEFVENQTILDILKSLGVDYAQGYGIGKPVALKELLSSFEKYVMCEHPSILSRENANE